MKHFLIIALAIALFGGCASPLIDAASMGMTGYDATMLADEYLPRDRIDFNTPYDCTDAVIERRMDERLLIRGYPELRPFSFGGHVYLVGEILDKQNGQRATSIAKSVQGIKSLTTHYFLIAGNSNMAHDHLLYDRLLKQFRSDKELASSPLRLTVVQSKAVIMGPASTPAIKRHAFKTARSTKGISTVIDYVVVAH